MHSDTSFEREAQSFLFTAFLAAMTNQFLNGLIYTGFIPYQLFPLVSLFSFAVLILVRAHSNFFLALVTALAARLPLIPLLNKGEIPFEDIPVIAHASLECLLIVLVISWGLKRNKLTDSESIGPLSAGLALVKAFSEYFLGYLVFGLWSAFKIWERRIRFGLDIDADMLIEEVIHYLQGSLYLFSSGRAADLRFPVLHMVLPAVGAALLARWIERKYFTASRDERDYPRR